MLYSLAVVDTDCHFNFRRDLAAPVQLRICFVKYAEASDVSVALHLNNTVFIDRALNVALYSGSKSKAFSLLGYIYA